MDRTMNVADLSRTRDNFVEKYRGQDIWVWPTGTGILNWTIGSFNGVGSATSTANAVKMARKVIDDAIRQEGKA